MNSTIGARLGRLLAEYKSRRESAAAFVFAAVLVVFGVTTAFRFTGIAVTHTERVLECQVSGTVAHAHNADCYDATGALVCSLPELELHVHSDDCYVETHELTCGFDEHAHDPSCFDSAGNLACSLSEHVHSDACYRTERVLVCGRDEITTEHVHGSGCFRAVEATDDDPLAAALAAAADSTDPDALSPDVTEPDLLPAEEAPAQAFAHEFKDPEGNVVLRVDVSAPEGALPADSSMAAAWVDPTSLAATEQTALDQAIAREVDGRVLDLQAMNLTFANAQNEEVEPATEVTVTLTSGLLDTEDQPVVVSVDSEERNRRRAEEQGTPEVAVGADVVEPLSEEELELRELELQSDELAFYAAKPSTYVLAVTTLEHVMRTTDNSTVTVTATAPAEAGIPAEAQLKVVEVPQGSGDHLVYESLATEALGAEERNVALARFFDIAIVDAEGNELQPAAPVNVQIELSDAPGPQEEAEAQVLHFADQSDRPELIPAEGADGVTTFEAEGFSVYGVVYTVDFAYGFDGETFELSMQGGDSIGLRELAQRLQLTRAVESKAASEEAALDQFMADVESVTFSDPSLVGVVEVEEPDNVWNLATNAGYHIVYPLGLTQDEVLQLSTKRYEAGDWAIVSLQPFSTTETLTIALKTGEVVSVAVTDEQPTAINSDGTVQTIANPAGTTIDLFDYWVVSPDLAGRDGWGDLNQQQGHDQANDANGLNGTGNNKGINSSASDTEHGHALKFVPAWEGTVYNGSKVGDTGNAWQSVNLNHRDGLNSYTGGIAPFQGIVAPQLVNGYPVLTENTKIGSTGESLAYLFDPTIAHAGKATYNEVNQLLYVDKDGYYTYDSRDYKADFNEGSKTFTLTEQTSTNEEIRGFWPFGTQEFWFGMHINTQFSMPSGGQVLNPSGQLKDMQFEFSGDDDVWIYIDGVLIGDAGGIHNRTEVDINFKTGQVIINGQSQGTIKSIFESEFSAEEFDSFEWEGDTFAAGTYHSFDFFYLERGGGQSNTYIHYNLVSTADFTAHKSYQGINEGDLLRRDQYQFELIGLPGRWESVRDPDTGDVTVSLDDPDAMPIMPGGGSESGAGTVASPKMVHDTSFNEFGFNEAWVYTTGTTEDGNVNYGVAQISSAEEDALADGRPSVYRYVIREIVPDDAVNAQGVTWANATDEQRAAGGFEKDYIIYGGTTYYMTARVTSWQETTPRGEVITRYGLSKTYYTDVTFTTPADDVTFADVRNRHRQAYGNVDFSKVDAAGVPLAGATFTLYLDEACTQPAKNPDSATDEPYMATSGADGKVSFEHVAMATYYMKETVAPPNCALDETVYKVVIADEGIASARSVITVLGDANNTPVSRIVNTEDGKLSVIKHWLNAAGAEVDGGEKVATVRLKRNHLVAEEGPSSSEHTVTVQMTVEDGGVQYGSPVSQTVTGDTVIIEWDDEWQRNFNWYLTIEEHSYEGWIGDEVVSTENYTFEQIDVDGRSRRLTIPNVQGDVSLTTKYWVNWLHSDGSHWNNLNNPVITASEGEPTYVIAEDVDFNSGNHTQTLTQGTWAHTWTVGGTESSHNGYDLPETDDAGNKYRYYVVELNEDGQEIAVDDSPLDGYTLVGYSPNNGAGVMGQGVIDVYNKSNQQPVDITIYKVAAGEDDQLTSTRLDGARFHLLVDSRKLTDLDIVPASGSGTVAVEDGVFTMTSAGVTIRGLEAGEYTLVEDEAPAGYIITQSEWPFTVSDDGTISGSSDAIDAGALTITVPNPPGAELPAAGGMGTTGIVALGLGLVLGAATVLLMRQEQE